MMDIFNTQGSPEVTLSDRGLDDWTNQTLKTAMDKSLVKPNRQRPSTVRAPQEVFHPPEPVSSDQSDSLCSESEGDQLGELGVLPNTQTWIHLMTSITIHPPTFHYIIYSYCCCHYLLRKLSCSIILGT
ncbi:hypothetical protein J4Q44_G00281620 [Coregonus suidteri]|uniref:Uncharacterized protein n=1 Tax=Coregonus suidteri TaxID=861788 RepID=A0AAN8KVU2_9TELE